MKEEALLAFKSVYFDAEEANEEATSQFEGVKHELILNAFRWWTKLARHKLSTKIDSVKVLHGPKEDGVDILVEMRETGIRFGINVKTSDEICRGAIFDQVISQITRSKRHRLAAYLIALCANLKTQASRVRNVIATISKHSENYAFCLPPENSYTIVSTFEEMHGFADRILSLCDEISKRKRRILVVGDVMLDHVLYGLPKPPPKRVQKHDLVNVFYSIGGVEDETYTPGGAAWAAAALSEFARVRLIGIVGNDWEAEKLEEELGKRKVKFMPIVAEKAPTTRKQYFFFKPGWEREGRWKAHTRFDRENIDLLKKTISESLEKKIIMEIRKNLSWKPHGILIDDYEKGFVTENILVEISNLAKAGKNTQIFVDPKYHWEIFSRLKIDTICPNVREALFGSGLRSEDTVNRKEGVINLQLIMKYLLRLPRKYRCNIFVIKADDRGAVMLEREDESAYNLRTVEALDVTRTKTTGICSGGVFDAVLFIGQLGGFNLIDCVTLANFAAGLRCNKKLGFPVKVAEIRDGLPKYNLPLPTPKRTVKAKHRKQAQLI